MTNRKTSASYDLAGLDLDFAPFDDATLKLLEDKVGQPIAHDTEDQRIALIDQLNSISVWWTFGKETGDPPTGKQMLVALTQIAKAARKLTTSVPVRYEQDYLNFKADDDSEVDPIKNHVVASEFDETQSALPNYDDSCRGNPRIPDLIEKALSPHVEAYDTFVDPNKAIQQETKILEGNLNAHSGEAWLVETFERIGMLADIAEMARAAREEMTDNSADKAKLGTDSGGDDEALPFVSTRNDLVAEFCDVYVSAFDKKIRFSRNEKTNKITGPLIRFLNQCLAVLDEEVPDETIYQIARNHRT